MKKIFFLIFAFIFIAVPLCFAAVIEGKVSYTVETAQTEAFSDVEPTISMDLFSDKIKDVNYKENKASLKNGSNFSDRSIQLFSRGTLKAYAVTYKDEPHFTYYYSTLINNLLFFDISRGNGEFPYKVLRYSYKGELLAVGFYVSEEERFLFDKNRRLISHWIGKDGFNENGKKIGNLEIISE